MGILDDLAMGFGLKEKDRDYYDRTAATIGRNQGSAASDKYVSGLGDKYKAAPNYSTAIGPSLSDFRQVPNTGSGANPYDASGNLRPDYKPGSAAQRYKDVGRPQPGTLQHTIVNSPSVLGLLANIFGGYKPIQPQGELQGVNAPLAGAPAPAATKDYGGYTPEPVTAKPLLPPARTEMSAFGFSPDQPNSDPDVQLEAFTGQPSAGPEFDAFIEMTADFPDFDGIRDNRDLMMDVFQKYKAMHRGAK